MKNKIVNSVVLAAMIIMLPLVVVAQVSEEISGKIDEKTIPVHFQKALSQQGLSNLLNYLKSKSVEFGIKNGNILLMVIDMNADSEEKINSILKYKDDKFHKNGFKRISPFYRDYQNNLTYATYAGYVGDDHFYIAKSVDHLQSKILIAISPHYYSFQKQGFMKSNFAAITR